MLRFLAIATTVTALSGCANVCDKISGAVDSLNKGGAACGSSSQTFDKACCNTKIADCSSDDQKKVSAWADCLTGVPNCVKGMELDWAGKIQACGDNLKGLSDACKQQSCAKM